MKWWLILTIIGIVFLAGCIQQLNQIAIPSGFEPSDETASGPTHELIEYLSMENPESFSYNYTETFSMPYVTQTENYKYLNSIISRVIHLIIIKKN